MQALVLMLPVWALTIASTSEAQDPVPTAFIHGFHGTNGSFISMRNDITSTHPRVSPVIPFLLGGSSELGGGHISAQAEQLRNILGPSNTEISFLIGHSNGGLVARTLAGNQQGAGPRTIVTFGTPHSGAPIVNNIAGASFYYLFLTESILATIGYGAIAFSYENQWPASMIAALGLESGWIASFGLPAAIMLGLDPLLPTPEISEDVAPGSAHLNWLNNHPSSGIADYYVPGRAGIIVTTRNSTFGGAFRMAFSPSAAEDAAYLFWSLGFLGLFFAADIYWDTWQDEELEASNPSLYYARLDFSYVMSAAAGALLLHDTTWCWWITGPPNCEAGDAFIPNSRQYYTWSGGDDAHYILANGSHVDEGDDPEVIAAVSYQVGRMISMWHP